MADIFISYKSERRAAAEHLADILRDHGYTVWWDYKVAAGHDFATTIETELRGASAVVVLWCSLSRNSRWVKEEAQLSQQLQKLIPVRMEDLELPLGFRLAQTIDMSAWDGAPRSGAVERLVREVAAVVGRQPQTNLEGLDRTDRAWRRYGAMRWRDFPLNIALEDTVTRSLPSEPGATGALTKARVDDRMVSSPADAAAVVLADFRAAWMQLARKDDPDVVKRFFDAVTLRAPGSGLAFEIEEHLNALIASRNPDAVQHVKETVEPRKRRPSHNEEFEDGEGLPLMIRVPAGEFTMGSAESERDRSKDEGPQRTVRIDYNLAIGKYPVTVGEWRRFARGYDTGNSAFVWSGPAFAMTPDAGWNKPGFAQDDEHPVTCVNWHDAKAYAQWLAKLSGYPYRLLSEAEWEYACRAHSTARYANGDTIAAKDANYGWRERGSSPVGSFAPNVFGLHDMAGNVWEWVEDSYKDTYAVAPRDGSAFCDNGISSRVVRGGSWVNIARNLRSASRHKHHATTRINDVGFRVARVLF